jgi:PTH1 family peptidyl-tRNA hydrolase
MTAKKKEKIKLIYGIGNESEKFSLTKHNLGKEIVKFYFSQPKELKYSILSKYNNIYLATNKGYVNNCGQGLKEILNKLKIKPENVLVIHDDADLIFPLFKISFGSSSAGHKGIESIIKNLKTKNFWRFRIGIQGNKREPAEKIVLKKWSAKEKILLEKIKQKFKIILEILKERLPNELNIKKDYFKE